MSNNTDSDPDPIVMKMSVRSPPGVGSGKHPDYYDDDEGGSESSHTPTTCDNCGTDGQILEQAAEVAGPPNNRRRPVLCPDCADNE